MDTVCTPIKKIRKEKFEIVRMPKEDGEPVYAVIHLGTNLWEEFFFHGLLFSSDFDRCVDWCIRRLAERVKEVKRVERSLVND